LGNSHVVLCNLLPSRAGHPNLSGKPLDVDSQVVLYNPGKLALTVVCQLFLSIQLAISLMMGSETALVIRMVFPPLSLTVRAGLTVNQIGGYFLPVVIAPPSALALGRKANGLLRVEGVEGRRMERSVAIAANRFPGFHSQNSGCRLARIFFPRRNPCWNPKKFVAPYRNLL
jgi:hypothetical protein